uniref:Uncharacterized protein n=1 Tax=Arundo donax TaxID=35708 RepID=A0A0A9HXH2_ARUDO
MDTIHRLPAFRAPSIANWIEFVA